MMQLTPHEEREIAAAAAVDPRTVRRYISGREVRSTCRAHIERALINLGRTDIVCSDRSGR
jgi:hypothetical protein